MKLMDAFRRRARLSGTDSERDGHTASGDPERAPRNLPDPARVPTARGSWEQAALTNVDITELVKRQINAQTPPWKK